MGRIPSFLLRKRITIEPYLGTWGQYGPEGDEIRCAYDERIISAVQQAGVVRAKTLTIVAPLETQCPEGSLVHLDDGSTGYASSVARHDSGGLPRVPDHVEIAVSLPAPSYGSPLGSESVSVLTRTATGGVDRYGSTVYASAEVLVPGAVVRVVAEDESGDGGGSSLSTTLEVILPPGTAVGANDRLRVRGLVYEIDGPPEARTDPMLGGQAGIRVIARRNTG